MPASSLKSLSVALILMALAGGTAGAGTISHVGEPDRYSADLLRFAVADGRLETVIHGMPLPGTDAAEIAASLQLPGSFPPTRFTPLAASGAADEVRLVLVFNPGFMITGERACRGSDFRVRDGRPGQWRLFAAFCRNEQAFAQGYLESTGVGGPADPRFGAEIRRFLAVILPRPQGRAGTGGGVDFPD